MTRAATIADAPKGTKMNVSDLPIATRAMLDRLRPASPATKAVGQLRMPKTMNKGEAAFERKLAGSSDVAWHRFEGITLKIGPDCRYTPDFPLMRTDGSIECHDVKGRKGDSFWAEEDAMIKIRTAAAMFPFRFFISWLNARGEWQSKEIVP